jgi:hypothetical protein
LKARDSINKVLGPFKADYKENGPSSSHELFIAPLKKALEEVEKADTDFKEQAFYVAEALSGKRFSLNY